MLRAAYSYQLIKASAERAKVSFASDSVNTSLRVSFSDLTASLDYISLAASYLVIAESLNRYLTDSLAFSDLASLSVSKSASDSVEVTELVALSVTVPQADSFGVSDVFSRTVAYARDFSDSASLTEAHNVTFNSVQSDSMSVSDSPALSSELNKGDSFSFSDAFTRTVSYHRDLADAFTMDDLANVGDLVKDTNLDKNNIFGVTESLSYSAQKAVADTLQMQEALSKAMASDFAEALSVSDDLSFSADLGLTDSAAMFDSPSKSVSFSAADSFGVSESITVNLVIFGRSAFNDNAFNAFAFNE